MKAVLQHGTGAPLDCALSGGHLAGLELTGTCRADQTPILGASRSHWEVFKRSVVAAGQSGCALDPRVDFGTERFEVDWLGQ